VLGGAPAVADGRTRDARATGPAAGVPWGLGGALLILLLVELVLRSADPKALVEYGLGEQEHRAVAAYIETLGPADVCFVGSSHTREGILAAEVRKRCERAGLGFVEVANYGMSAARADAAEAVVNRILAQSRKPRLILCGLSVRDLRCPGRDWPRLANFWGVGDWARHLSTDPREVGPLFPNVVRNEIGRRYRTLGYHESLRRRLARWVSGESATPSAVFGQDLTESHQENRSLKRRGVDDERVATYLAFNRLDTPEWSEQDRLMLDGLLRLCARCREAGVELVLYEMPMSQPLRRRISEGLYDAFLSITREAAAGTGVSFVTTRDLAMDVGDGGFSEYSHLNHKGAMRLTRALAEQVVIPRLRAAASDE
jgi:hypothetical protein